MEPQQRHSSDSFCSSSINRETINWNSTKVHCMYPGTKINLAIHSSVRESEWLHSKSVDLTKVSSNFRHFSHQFALPLSVHPLLLFMARALMLLMSPVSQISDIFSRQFASPSLSTPIITHRLCAGRSLSWCGRRKVGRSNDLQEEDLSLL